MKCLDIHKGYKLTACYTNTNQIYLWDNSILWHNKIETKTFIDKHIKYLIIDKKDLIPFPQNTSKNLPFFLFGSNWNINNHKYTHYENKLIIKTFLILSLLNKKRILDDNYKPKYPQSLLYLLPRDIIIEILQYLPL
jgi:hypothetical protein